MFSQIARMENLKLRTLNLGRHPQNARNSHLSAVEPDVFATAICKLENVEVDYNNLSFDQMDALFSKMTLDQHYLKSLIVSYDKSLKGLSESVVTQALITLKHIEFNDLPQRYFNHFIKNVKVKPGVKTRFITTNFETRMRQQKMLEDALAQNVHINFIPSHTGSEEEARDCETEEQTDDDFDRVHEMENIQLSEENMNELAQIMMMRMMNDLGATGN